MAVSSNLKKSDVVLIEGNYPLKRDSDTSVLWILPDETKIDLQFESAYEISHTWEDRSGINDCKYRVHSREFIDLSFRSGKTIEKLGECHEIREHQDGTRFLYRFEDIPIFDSDDGIWDRIDEFILYRDSRGVNMINCRHGMYIPRIKIYIALKNSDLDLIKLLDAE